MADVSVETASPLKAQLPPGASGESTDVWGAAASLFRQEKKACFVVADANVLRLHPSLKAALKGHVVVSLPARESSKSLAVVERLSALAQMLPRSGTVIALGGGTIGDVTTVFAHLHKRGVRLIHVPTTLLAAVDSSIGGKGGVNVKGLKNALGVFHQPDACWLCPELWVTLSESRRREGAVEALKMAATLDAAVFLRWAWGAVEQSQWIREARALKTEVCRVDPYERKGVRVVLNFGHSFGHAIETASRFKVPHGEAVALGMVCALDIGCATGVTPSSLRAQVLAQLPQSATLRRRLQKAFRPLKVGALQKLLWADKKNDAPQTLKMVLLKALGQWTTIDVEPQVWQAQMRAWKSGSEP
jgi:3-dehydroquinate synthase